MTTTKTTYREPGEGAIEFAREYVKELSRDEALLTIKRLLEGELHNTTDKRIKRCDFCGYWWRDASLRNTKKTCSSYCKTKIKTLQRRKHRERAALLNPKPKKETKREVNYVHWVDYPYWINEYEMLKQSWKYENPYSPNKINQIAAAKERTERMGGKRKPKRVVPYNGDEDIQPKTSVKFVKERGKNYSEVVISFMKPEEISAYFSSKYSERHLKLERRRAILSGDKKV